MRTRTVVLLAPVVVATGLIAAVLALRTEEPLGTPCLPTAGPVSVAGVDPMAGKSLYQIASASRSMHRSRSRPGSRLAHSVREPASLHNPERRR